MRRDLYILFCFVLLGVVVQSCEQDDICPESIPTTPKLVVRFYDATNTTETKQVNDLLVYGLNDLNEAIFLDQIGISTTDSIAIPLRNDSNFTKLVFHKDIEGFDLATGNSDVTNFDHTSNQEYVSRACGYKNTYQILTSALTADADNWITDIEIINEIVENEFEAHVKIYH